MSFQRLRRAAMKSCWLLLPYAELMRLHKPVGVLNIFFPYFYGFFFAVLTSQPVRPPAEIFPWPILPLAFSTFLLRSMGCAWNDIIDMDLDRLVERTKSRPMARGAIPTSIAYCFTFGLLIAWVTTLTHLVPSGLQLGSYTAPLITLVMFYPYAKRFTAYAQVVLGITLGWGVFFGAAFAGVDVIHIFSSAMIDAADSGDPMALKYAFLNSQVLGLSALYAAYIIWSVIHDTIYAFQDLHDDKRIGLNSMAVRLLRHTKPVLSYLCVLQVALLAYTAMMMCCCSQFSTEGLAKTFGTQWAFMVFSVIGNAVILLSLIVKVDLEDPQSCSWWFKASSTLVGSSIGLGFTIQYLTHIPN